MSEFYGVQDQERLDSDPDDTIIGLLEDVYFDDLSFHDFPIKVYGFTTEKPFENIEQYANNMLENILEGLDENYGDPDSYGTEMTPNMKEATLNLAKVFEEEYQVFNCERTGEVIKYSKEQAMKTAGIKEHK